MTHTQRYHLAATLALALSAESLRAADADQPWLKPDPAALKRWQEMRFGMFIHWGPVSLTHHEIGWSRGAQTPIEEYDNLYKKFNPVKFNADEWAAVAKAAGMKYMVLTTKHHDGFCLFATKETDYNVMNSPFRRDVTKELADASLDGCSLLPFLVGKDDPWFADRMIFQHNARWPSGTAAQHKDCMAGVRWRDCLFVRSRSCGETACIRSGVSQCGALENVARGGTVATYTKNAQFIWGLTPGDGWALYDVRKDPACRTNLASKEKSTADKLHQAYDKWWNTIYPEMIAAGGDAPLTQAAVQRVKGKRK
ncbi:MAG: hypothetical protein FJ388_15675 [Verrucomicrobia bacterium]|nr:hypothetical protein [Verrucomicrobiota bacterium]